MKACLWFEKEPSHSFKHDSVYIPTPTEMFFFFWCQEIFPWYTGKTFLFFPVGRIFFSCSKEFYLILRKKGKKEKTFLRQKKYIFCHCSMQKFLASKAFLWVALQSKTAFTNASADKITLFIFLGHFLLSTVYKFSRTSKCVLHSYKRAFLL